MSLNLCRWGTINLKGKSWGKKTDTVSLPRSESFDLPLLRSSFETWRRNSSPWGEGRVGQPVEAEEMQRVTVNESLTGLRVPAPTSLCGSRILPCPWGHWWDYSNCDCVTMVTCWCEVCAHSHTYFQVPTVIHPEWRLGKHFNICLYSQRWNYWDIRLSKGKTALIQKTSRVIRRELWGYWAALWLWI